MNSLSEESHNHLMLAEGQCGKTLAPVQLKVLLNASKPSVNAKSLLKSTLWVKCQKGGVWQCPALRVGSLLHLPLGIWLKSGPPVIIQSQYCNKTSFVFVWLFEIDIHFAVLQAVLKPNHWMEYIISRVLPQNNNSAIIINEYQILSVKFTSIMFVTSIPLNWKLII